MTKLLLTASAAALIAGPAFAQAGPDAGPSVAPAPGAADAPTESPKTSPAANVADNPGEEGIADIVVTATRRESSLQRTAVAITAVSSDQLYEKGVVNVVELTKLVPAVKVGQLAGNATQVTIRGVGNFGGNSFAEPGVAFNVDGQYLARNAGASGIFYDVQRVEVLKGPQGTLYGRNSTGGVINIVTVDPGKEFNGFATVEGGNLDTKRVTAAATVPIADWLSVRAAGQIVDRDGKFGDGTGSDKTKAARLKAKLTPTDDFSLLLEADWTRSTGGPGFGGFVLPGFDPYKMSGASPIQNAVFNLLPPAVSATLPRIGTDTFNRNTSRGLQATGVYDFGPAAATIIVANRRNTAFYKHYGAGFPVTDDNRDDPSEYTTVEARLSSSGESRLKWVLGGFYFDDDLHTRISPDQGSTFQNANVHVYTKSYSGFAEGTFSLTDSFRLTGGARYTRDKKEIAGTSTGPILAPPPAYPLVCPAASGSTITTAGAPFRNPANTNSFAALCTSPIAGQNTFKKTTYKAGVEADVAEKSLVYATVATGFKAGGFYSSLNTAPAGSFPNNAYRPETLTAYTVGSKNRFADDSVQLNGEAFYWDYKNKQVPHIGIVQPGNNINLVVDNAASARLYGAEAELVWKPVPAGAFNLDVQYLHSKYRNFTYGVVVPGRIANPAAVPATGCAFTPVLQPGGPGTPGVSTVDCSGKRVPFAPQWTLNAGYRHTFELGNGSKLIPGVSTHIESSFFLGEEYIAGQKQDSSTVSDADLTWTSPKEMFSVTAFVQNIEDKKVGAASFVQPTLGLARIGYRNPRTYGARASVRF